MDYKARYEAAITTLQENIRNPEKGIAYGGIRDNDKVRAALEFLLASTPTPPSAGQEVERNILKSIREIENGESYLVPSGISTEQEFFNWLESVTEQPYSAA